MIPSTLPYFRYKIVNIYKEEQAKFINVLLVFVLYLYMSVIGVFCLNLFEGNRCYVAELKQEY